MKNLDFDLVRTIKVIQMDKDLNTIFTKNFLEGKDESFETVLNAAKNGLMAVEASQYAESIFTDIILKRKSLTELYSRNVAPAKETVVKTSVAKAPKVKKLPKEYNKIRIVADIKENDGVATEFHKAMLALNEMKNMRAKLNAKGNRQRYADGKPYTDAECREIIAVVQIMKNRLSKIV